jgi:Fe-Mn family superoxide dismutase
MNFDLPPLPYPLDALAPLISAETLEFHYGKHHQSYLTNLKNLIGGKPEAGQSLEEIIRRSEGPVFDNAAQVWNHTFYWRSMKKGGGGAPTGPLADAIERDFGGSAQFKEAFTKAAVGQFGSGWAWLVKEHDGTLRVTTTSNGDLPLRRGQTPLITCDVWEHAYYLDYRNRRPKYVEAFLTALVNWDFAAANFA